MPRCKSVCTFRSEWLTNPELKNWIQRVPGNATEVFCRICPKQFSLSSMGRPALSSHMKSKKHQKNAAAISQNPRLEEFIFTSRTTDTTENTATLASESALNTTQTHSVSLDVPNVPASCATAGGGAMAQSSTVPFAESRSLDRFLLNDEVTKAEILWCLDCIMNHNSMRSAGKSVNLFSVMFSDSKIAAKMKLQKSKIGYVLLYGLAPYFKNKLIEVLQNSPHIVVGFDESLNKVCQRQQMDINLRFWDNVSDTVCTRYFTSVFLGSCKAVDLLKGFMEAVACLDVRKLFQVSMDGPNVNVKFFNDLKIKLKEDDISTVLLDLGSCGIHTTHNAFKAAMVATDWKIAEFLRAVYNLFKNVPARRALYTSFTESQIFPKKFCSVRWLENSDVAERAIEMLPFLRKFIEGVEKNKVKVDSSCFSTVKEHMKDPMIGPKLAFFKTIAIEVEPFLREFQSDWPLAPFLNSALSSTVLSVMERFVKETAINISVDLSKEENLIPVKSIEIGFETSKEIKKCKKLTENEVFLFRNACRKSLQKFVAKILERSPLKHRLCYAISSLDPAVACKREGRDKMKKLLDILCVNKWISSRTAENATREFKVITANSSAKEIMKKFKRRSQRLDTFWTSLLDDMGEESDSFKQIMKMTLILSHGNASIERGFSVNGECLVDNMLEETLVAHRIIYDSVSALGGIGKFPITKKLILEARNAHSRYKEAVSEKQKSQSQNEKQKSKEREIKAKVRMLATKKTQLLEEARKEAQSIDKEIEGLKQS